MCCKRLSYSLAHQGQHPKQGLATMSLAQRLSLDNASAMHHLFSLRPKCIAWAGTA